LVIVTYFLGNPVKVYKKETMLIKRQRDRNATKHRVDCTYMYNIDLKTKQEDS